MRFSANADGPSLALTKSRGGAIGTEAIVQDDDTLGSIEWYGDDGADQASGAASIVAAVDGTPGSNDLPGRLMFSTTADGAASPSEHMRIAANGRLGINLGDFNNISGNIEVEGIGDDIGSGMYPDDADGHQLLNIAAGGDGDVGRRGVLKLISTNDGANNSIAMGSVGGADCDFNIWTRRSTGLGAVTLRIKGDGSTEATGAFSKASGSFKIDHPLKPDTHHLIHSFAESNETLLIHRGTVDLVDGSAQIDLDVATGMSSGTWIALCRDEQVFTSNESAWAAVRGSVTGSVLTIDCEDADCTDTVAWTVFSNRHDDHIFATAWTDEQGRPIIEPLKVAPDPDPEP
jgi:hypothetical protein